MAFNIIFHFALPLYTNRLCWSSVVTSASSQKKNGVVCAEHSSNVLGPRRDVNFHWIKALYTPTEHCQTKKYRWFTESVHYCCCTTQSLSVWCRIISGVWNYSKTVKWSERKKRKQTHLIRKALALFFFPDVITVLAVGNIFSIAWNNGDAVWLLKRVRYISNTCMCEWIYVFFKEVSVSWVTDF